MATTEKLVSVGWLGKSRGINGEIYVTPTSDFPERFLHLEEIYVAEADEWKRMRISSARLVGGRPVIRFQSVSSREEAIKLTNRELAIEADKLIDLPPDSYFTFDLVGCRVIESLTGRELGEVTDVQKYPANDVYVIKTTSGQEVLFPAVKQYVNRVDIEKRRIEIDPGGLFDDT